MQISGKTSKLSIAALLQKQQRVNAKHFSGHLQSS
jgi:hypothetical protein